MQKHHAWLVVTIIMSPMLPAFSQSDDKPQEAAHPQHMVVPLASKEDGRISGDPDKPGAAFVIRIYNDANAIVPPHWHPEDEHIVVIKGTCSFGMGDTFDRRALRELNVGDYTFMPKKMPHFGWAKSECICPVCV